MKNIDQSIANSSNLDESISNIDGRAFYNKPKQTTLQDANEGIVDLGAIDMSIVKKQEEVKQAAEAAASANTPTKSVSKTASIKDMFTVKNVAIAVVVLGLTFGILKYKKII